MRFILYKDFKGEYRWTLKAGNGKIMADSAESYKRNPYKVIQRLRSSLCNTEIIDLTRWPYLQDNDAWGHVIMEKTTKQ